MSVLYCEQPTSLSKLDFERMIGQCFIIWNARVGDIAFMGTISDVIHTTRQTFIEVVPANHAYRKTAEIDASDPRYDEHYIISGETQYTVWIDLDIALGHDPGFEHFSGHRVVKVTSNYR